MHNNVVKAFILFIAQGAYSGKCPFAPGTAGTVVGVLLYLWMKALSPSQYLILTVLVFIVGTWAAGQAEVILGRKDSPSIVIDEIAGYLVAMFMVPSGWGFIVAGFFLFRIFDIIKPYPLYQLQDLHGGLGVMFDDILAAGYTLLCLALVKSVLL
jgi:phosphatidylglycerophosphatase A